MGRVTKVTVTIETTNAAFEEDFLLEYNNVFNQARLEDGQKLYDSNGNAVGTVELEVE